MGGGYCREGLGGGCSHRHSHAQVLEVVFTYTSNKFRVTASLVKLVFSIEVRYIYRCSHKGNIHKKPKGINKNNVRAKRTGHLFYDLFGTGVGEERERGRLSTIFLATLPCKQDVRASLGSLGSGLPYK